MQRPQVLRLARFGMRAESKQDLRNSDKQRAAATRRQVARFAVVGGGSVAVDLFVYWLLTTSTAMLPDVAKGLSYGTGVVLGFCGNKWWTFESRRRNASEPIVYLLLYAITLGVNVGCNRAVLALLGQDAAMWAFLFATGVTTVLNFLGMKLVTFRQRAHEPDRVATEAFAHRRAA